MTAFDNRTPEQRIDALHAEAEDLADLAKHTDDTEEAARLRKEATALVRRAARIREEEGL